MNPSSFADLARGHRGDVGIEIDHESKKRNIRQFGCEMAKSTTVCCMLLSRTHICAANIVTSDRNNVSSACQNEHCGLRHHDTMVDEWTSLFAAFLIFIECTYDS